MRSKRTMRTPRPAHMAVGALMLAVPGSAVALAAKPSDTKSAPAQSATLRIKLSPRRIASGDRIFVTGTAGPVAAGRRVELELQPAGQRGWRVLATTRIHRNGSFRLPATLRTSGRVRVIPAPSAQNNDTAPVTATTTSTTTTTTPTGGAQIVPSDAAHVTVAARLSVPNGTVSVLGGGHADIRGRLIPGIAGRRVRLLARSHGHWQSIATARTSRHGRFDLQVQSGATSSGPLRVKFAGDRFNAGASKPAGHVIVFSPSVASWYNDGGNTACGFHAGYGVANRTLPCGTKVTFSYRGHTVTATVDDRGPFVGGRDWDLNQNTAAALGFDGVATVWTSS